MKQAYQALIKALGRGAKGARALTLKESTFLISGFHEGIGSQVQLAAALMLMRVRGESAAEIAGVAIGIKSTINEQWREVKPTIDWPCYAGKRELLPWLLLAAKVLATQGERILLHGDPKSLSHRKHIAAFVSALDIPSVSTPDDAKSALDHGGICYVDADNISPLVAKFRHRHQELGLRSLFQTAIRCINPGNAPVSVRSYFHPGMDELHAEIAEMMAGYSANQDSDDGLSPLYESTTQERVGIFKGVQGESEVNPRIATELTIVSKEGREKCSIPTLLEGVVGLNTLTSHIQLEAEQAPALLGNVWLSNPGSDEVCLFGFQQQESAEKLMKIANASVIGTLAMVYLLKGRCEHFSDAEELARTSWSSRHGVLTKPALT
ncbi:glycosyl transferase [Shewanella canadensis]|uniref:Glycosyl transferase n=1 Tax=Shewanella canadensis TaxID=271096 RepID=A0A431WVR3_9GAMM|nr:glycosyl transferase [Shewanella canadensis]RTR39520.1 glycosyl transferase [Shewanella canadensis]